MGNLITHLCLNFNGGLVAEAMKTQVNNCIHYVISYACSDLDTG